eukprot:13412479-Alexandrium_andersonii.AAC.1
MAPPPAALFPAGSLPDQLVVWCWASCSRLALSPGVAWAHSARCLATERQSKANDSSSQHENVATTSAEHRPPTTNHQQRTVAP